MVVADDHTITEDHSLACAAARERHLKRHIVSQTEKERRTNAALFFHHMPPPPPPPLTRVLRPALLLLAVGAFHAALAAPTSLPAATSSTVILMSDTHRPLPLPSKTAKLHFTSLAAIVNAFYACCTTSSFSRSKSRARGRHPGAVLQQGRCKCGPGRVGAPRICSVWNARRRRWLVQRER